MKTAIPTHYIYDEDYNKDLQASGYQLLSLSTSPTEHIVTLSLQHPYAIRRNAANDLSPNRHLSHFIEEDPLEPDLHPITIGVFRLGTSTPASDINSLLRYGFVIPVQPDDIALVKHAYGSLRNTAHSLKPLKEKSYDGFIFDETSLRLIKDAIQTNPVQVEAMRQGVRQLKDFAALREGRQYLIIPMAPHSEKLETVRRRGIEGY